MGGVSEDVLRLYHRTPNGAQIMLSGFRDATGTYGMTSEYTGVFLSDQPLDINEGASGEDLVEVVASEAALVDYEWSTSPHGGGDRRSSPRQGSRAVRAKAPSAVGRPRRAPGGAASPLAGGQTRYDFQVILPPCLRVA
jgi:hypothetical protein